MKPRHSLIRRFALALSLALILSVPVTAGLLVVPTSAAADEYDVDYAGHPLRIAAYIGHPIGVIIDRLILRPCHWLGSREPLRTLFGHQQTE